MANYAFLMGYGLFKEPNNSYRGYLYRFAKFAKMKKIDVAVLCGGHTNPYNPKLSEAGTMADYLKPRLGKGVRIKLQDRAFTAPQNFEYARRYISLGPKDKVFVISDGVRFFKIYWFVLHYWFHLGRKQIWHIWGPLAEKHKGAKAWDIKDRLNYKNVSIHIDSLHSNYDDAFGQLIASWLEIESLYDKRLYSDMVRYQKLYFRRYYRKA